MKQMIILQFCFLTLVGCSDRIDRVSNPPPTEVYYRSGTATSDMVVVGDPNTRKADYLRGYDGSGALLPQCENRSKSRCFRDLGGGFGIYNMAGQDRDWETS